MENLQVETSVANCRFVNPLITNYPKRTMLILSSLCLDYRKRTFGLGMCVEFFGVERKRKFTTEIKIHVLLMMVFIIS